MKYLLKIDIRSNIRGTKLCFLMRINKDWTALLGILLSIILGIGVMAASFTGLYYLVQFIWFLQDNNFFGFPIWTFLIVTVLGGMFINSIYNELKFNKLEPNRKNLINQSILSTLILGLNIGLIALVIYLINLWISKK